MRKKKKAIPTHFTTTISHQLLFMEITGGEVLEMLDFAGNDTNFLDAYDRLFSIKGCEPDITRGDFWLGYTILVYKTATNMKSTLSLE